MIPAGACHTAGTRCRMQCPSVMIVYHYGRVAVLGFSSTAFRRLGCGRVDSSIKCKISQYI